MNRKLYLVFILALIIGHNPEAWAKKRSAKPRQSSRKCSDWGQTPMMGQQSVECNGIQACQHEHGAIPEARGELEDSLHLTSEARSLAKCVIEKFCPVPAGNQAQSQKQQCAILISGYRDKVHNQAGVGIGKGRAECSQHLLGLAVDLRVIGRSLRELQSAFVSCGARWHHLYPESDGNFVHGDMRGTIDTKFAKEQINQAESQKFTEAMLRRGF